MEKKEYADGRLLEQTFNGGKHFRNSVDNKTDVCLILYESNVMSPDFLFSAFALHIHTHTHTHFGIMDL